VRVRRHVDRDTVDRGREIGPMIELETAQVILVGLAFPAVLTDDQTGDLFKDLARAEQRTIGDLLCVDGARGRGRSGSDEVGRAPRRGNTPDLL